MPESTASPTMSDAHRQTLTSTLQKMMHHFVSESVAPNLTPDAPATSSMLKALDLTDSLHLISPGFFSKLPEETKKLLFSFLFERNCAIDAKIDEEGVENSDARKKTSQAARQVMDTLTVDASIIAAEVTKILPASEAMAATSTIKETKRRKTETAPASDGNNNDKVFHRKIDKLTDYIRSSMKKIQRPELVVPPLQKAIEYCLASESGSGEDSRR